MRNQPKELAAPPSPQSDGDRLDVSSFAIAGAEAVLRDRAAGDLTPRPLLRLPFKPLRR